MVHKVLASRSPQYIFNMFSTDYTRETRQASRMEIKQDRDHPELGLTMDSFRWRATRDYNRLPVELRKQQTYILTNEGPRNLLHRHKTAYISK